MKTVLECIPCFVRQASEAVSLVVADPGRREALLRKLLGAIAAADWHGSPPTIGQRIHRIIRRELGNPDPYHEIKKSMNRTAKALLPALRQAMQSQPDPREAAIRLAIAGNLLDAGAKTLIAAEDLPGHLNSIWTKRLQGSAARLFQAAEKASRILYLADNAGEIFFDRVLIEALPVQRITVVVRGAPVINDATMEDAIAAGLPEIAQVLDNGSDAPGTILEDCSETFRRSFAAADLVIAKGQGNYETLSEITKHIFFLFTVKCPVIASRTGTAVGDLVIIEKDPEDESVKAGKRGHLAALHRHHNKANEHKKDTGVRP